MHELNGMTIDMRGRRGVGGGEDGGNIQIICGSRNLSLVYPSLGIGQTKVIFVIVIVIQ